MKYCVLNTTNRETRSCQYDLTGAPCKTLWIFPEWQSPLAHWTMQVRLATCRPSTCSPGASSDLLPSSRQWASQIFVFILLEVQPYWHWTNRRLQNVLERKKSNFNFRSVKSYNQSRWSVFWIIMFMRSGLGFRLVVLICQFLKGASCCTIGWQFVLYVQSVK